MKLCERCFKYINRSYLSNRFYTSTNEIIELCKVVTGYRGSYTSYIRNESHDVIGAAKEEIEIGEKAHVPVAISHHKIAGVPYWGL